MNSGRPTVDLEQGRAMLQRARQAADLDHPNLLPIREVQTEDSGVRVILEEDGGVSLQTLLKRGPLTEAQAVAVGMGVLSGLRALERAGLGHGALDTSKVHVSPGGRARLTGYGLAPFQPRADLAAAGRVLCAALGVDPRPAAGRLPGKLERSRPRLVAAARAIAAGGAGRSVATGIMLFGDAAGEIDSRWRIERTVASMEKLAIPPPAAIAAAVDRVLQQPVAAQAPAPVAPLVALPVRMPRRALPAALVAASVLAVLLLAALPAFHRTAPVHPAAASAPAAPVAKPAPAEASTPDAAVTAYYRLAAAHRFDEAFALWDENLRTTLPPAQYPDRRFANTTALTVNKATVTSQEGPVAMVATDLTEVTGGVEWHWIGSWRLVKTSGVWLLDRPDFKPA